MEQQGMLIDQNVIRELQKGVKLDVQAGFEGFRWWAASRVPDARLMSEIHDSQLRQLLFAGVPLPLRPGQVIADSFPLVDTFRVPNPPHARTHLYPRRTRIILLHGLWGPTTPSPLQPQAFTPKGLPSVGSGALRPLAGRPLAALAAYAALKGTSASPAVAGTGDYQEEMQASVNPVGGLLRDPGSQKHGDYGELYDAFGGGEAGLEASAALDVLLQSRQRRTWVSEVALLKAPDHAEHVPKGASAHTVRDDGLWRVHCSRYIGLQIGHLTPLRLRLLEQLSDNRYGRQLRRALAADVAAGNTMMVARLNDLPLHVLASLAPRSPSAELAGHLSHGPGTVFASIAAAMYPHIEEAIDSGRCRLEAPVQEIDSAEPAIPLVADMYPQEHRLVKELTLRMLTDPAPVHFGRAIGLDDAAAQKAIEEWRRVIPEVGNFHKELVRHARVDGHVETLLGRQLAVPPWGSSEEQAAANTRLATLFLVMGSTVDVKAAVLLALGCGERAAALRAIGWQPLTSVDNEFLLEGPTETVENAWKLVHNCVTRPLADDYNLSLNVTLHVGPNLHDAV
mmetsp:Transcript_16768/g.50097  ORF Transcript_16768/g.50097 Transcript_16768/m.50097 type:complete len:566 (+) Transcript_16768:309-2006(+)